MPDLPSRGGEGGLQPNIYGSNDTHVALIILTTQMWGGGNYWWKKLFRAKICVPAPSAPTSVLTQNKGPDTEPHFSNPPPSFGGRPCHPRPPALCPPTMRQMEWDKCHPRVQRGAPFTAAAGVSLPS